MIRNTPGEPECIECRLVLIEPHSMRILTTGAAASLLLPRESIPAYSRAAESLTETIERKLGLRTIQLALLPGRVEVGTCAVHEIIGSRKGEPGLLAFTALDDIAAGEFVGEERSIVIKIMKGEAGEFGRFAQLGWIDQLLVKVGSDARRYSWQAIQQLNQGINFCLLSLTDAAGAKMWFKAVGESNVREYGLTMALAQRFPAYLPKILAKIPEWNGWVMEDVRGMPLNQSEGLHDCKQALTALAIMQKEMTASLPSLVRLGARDWTCARIASLLEQFFHDARYAMEGQSSTKSRPLARTELDQLKKDINSALHEFMDGGVPETLVHGDIGHGNTFATSKGPVFLDWAETYIGHPFLSAEHLLADLARSMPVVAEEQAALRFHYAAHWNTCARQAKLARLTAIAPMIAAFAYAVIAWDGNRNRTDPTVAWPFLRSMLRRVRHEFELAPVVAV